MPYPMGNIHPRFWAWYMGSSNFTGALGDFLAAIQGSNLGGGNHAAALMDQQVVDWCKEMLGFPASASGTLVSGGSMANIIGLTVARNVKAGIDVREHGVAAIEKPLRFYGSDQIHSCHRKAIEALGLGNRALRRIPTDDDLRIDIDALRAAIARGPRGGISAGLRDRQRPARSTPARSTICRRSPTWRHEEDLWFHVDGCIGALIAIAPEQRPSRRRHRTRRFRRARSAQMAARAVRGRLRPGPRRRRASADASRCTPEYLETAPRGLASATGCYEYGLQTTRGFRALKVWMALKEHGVEKFGRLIDQNIAQARYLDGADRGRAAAGAGRAHRRSTSSASAISPADPDEIA